MPVGRGGDVYDIHFGKRDELTMVVEGLDAAADLLGGRLQMTAVDVADGNNAGACVFDMPHTHATRADDALRELVTRGDIPFAYDMAGDDEKSRCHGCTLAYEPAPAFQR